MRLDELLARCGEPGGPPVEVTGLTADSRAVRPGMLFAALPGARTDGARFLGAAVAAGAAAVLLPEGAPWPEGVPPVPALRSADPRRLLARLAAALHGGAQPEVAIAVTGTNGKTSTVDFLRQMLAALGLRAASIGTLGLIAPGFPAGESLTTPDPVSLHGTLAALAASGVTHLALEASSHGLDQRRLDGMRLAAGGFTNLTRDHLDYHGSMEAYRAAKLRLFEALLPPGAPAAFPSEIEGATLAALRAVAASRGLRPIEVGRDLRLHAQTPLPQGQHLLIEGFGVRTEVELALPGRFQAENALLAAALLIGLGFAPARVLGLLPGLVGVRGRMERAAVLPQGATVYVDYAHTPDALARLLEALRPHVAPGGRLHVLFGAGGERDPGKRPLMGAAAAAGADVVWVTDDNPRGEDPAAIRAAVLAGARGGAAEVHDAGAREDAIAAALAALRPGDVLAVAGKGHETGQTIAGVTLPFDDVAVVRRLAGAAA